MEFTNTYLIYLRISFENLYANDLSDNSENFLKSKCLKPPNVTSQCLVLPDQQSKTKI